MPARRGLFVAPFDGLADPRVVAELARRAEAGGWEGFFVWDHLQYGDRVRDVADVWTCCAAVATSTERVLLGPMVTPLARRRPQVLARQAASLALLSSGRFVLGLGLGDDGLGEFADFGDETDPRVRGRMLDEGLTVLQGLLSGEPVDHDGEHFTARGARFSPAPRVPLWLAGRHGNAAPLRRAARHDGFFVIGLEGPAGAVSTRESLLAAGAPVGHDLVVDLQPDQDPGPWLEGPATWVLTRVGPFDLDAAGVERAFALADGGPA